MALVRRWAKTAGEGDSLSPFPESQILRAKSLGNS
jgi:hypothetical protein